MGEIAVICIWYSWLQFNLGYIYNVLWDILGYILMYLIRKYRANTVRPFLGKNLLGKWTADTSTVIRQNWNTSHVDFPQILNVIDPTLWSNFSPPPFSMKTDVFYSRDCTCKEIWKYLNLKAICIYSLEHFVSANTSLHCYKMYFTVFLCF